MQKFTSILKANFSLIFRLKELLGAGSFIKWNWKNRQHGLEQSPKQQWLRLGSCVNISQIPFSWQNIDTTAGWPRSVTALHQSNKQAAINAAFCALASFIYRKGSKGEDKGQRCPNSTRWPRVPWVKRAQERAQLVSSTALQGYLCTVHGEV